MSIVVGFTVQERCDSCDKLTDEPVVTLKNRSREHGMIQLWIHPSCFPGIEKKAKKLIEKAGL